MAVANIQQIAGEENRSPDELEPDFFDLIPVDEAHHNTAASWQQVKRRFPEARIVNFSATPMRADPQAAALLARLAEMGVGAIPTMIPTPVNAGKMDLVPTSGAKRGISR